VLEGMKTAMRNYFLVSILSFALLTLANAQRAERGGLRSRFVARFRPGESGGISGHTAIRFLRSAPNTAVLTGVIRLNGDEGCFPGGQFQLHMHNKWVGFAPGQTSASGDACGSPATGAHIDATLACGPASQNAAVCAAGAPFLSNSLADYQCTPSTYATTRTLSKTLEGVDILVSLCQTGDYNNKFGNSLNALPDPKTNALFQTFSKSARGDYKFRFLDPQQVDVSTMTEAVRSVVLHCADGTRAACASYENF